MNNHSCELKNRLFLNIMIYSNFYVFETNIILFAKIIVHLRCDLYEFIFELGKIDVNERKLTRELYKHKSWRAKHLYEKSESLLCIKFSSVARALYSRSLGSRAHMCVTCVICIAMLLSGLSV